MADPLTFLILHSEYGLSQTLSVIIEQIVLESHQDQFRDNIHRLGHPRNYWKCGLDPTTIDVVLLEVRNTDSCGGEAWHVATDLRNRAPKAHVILLSGPTEEALLNVGLSFDGDREHFFSTTMDERNPATRLADLITRLLNLPDSE